MTAPPATAAAPMSPLLIPRPYRVTDRIDEASDIVTLHVAPTTGDLPSFEPAQVSMLGAFGVGEAAISISSAVHTTDHHAYTIRRAGPITNALVDTPIGGTITVRGPFGTPWPLAGVTTAEVVIVAGGLGIAPLRALIEQVVATIDRFDRVTLIYGARRPDQLLYQPDRQRWNRLGLSIATIVDEGDGTWSGAVGRVPDLLIDGGVDGGIDPAIDGSATTAFVCGPDVMMHHTAMALRARGLSPNRIWLTLERNMQCGNALCGHCQLGPFIVCRDGPVVDHATIAPFHSVDEL